MDAREYLGRIRKLDLKISQKQNILKDLEKKADGVNSADLKMVRKEVELDIARYFVLRNEVIDLIHKLDKSKFIMVLHAKWIDGDSLEKISAETSYSFDTVRKWYWMAMKEIQKIINEGQAE